MNLADSTTGNDALVVVDVQQGFDDPWWGRRNNPSADANIAALVEAFATAGRPLVYVRHDSDNPNSPLHPSSAGNGLKPYLRPSPDLLVTKRVNSSFHGTPDLHTWLTQHGIQGFVVAGITTNHCCETTTRVGANLGYAVRFALDATHTFDRTGPDGRTLTGDELAQATATNLHGEFATILSTRQVLAELTVDHPSH
jgi:nicotinamidase-related amidase